MARFGYQNVVLDPRASAAFAHVHSRLDGNHHARLELRGFSGKDKKSRIVIAKAGVVSGVMGEKRRKSLSGDLIPGQCVNEAGGNTGTYAIDRGLLRISGNGEYLRNFRLQGAYRRG